MESISQDLVEQHINAIFRCISRYNQISTHNLTTYLRALSSQQGRLDDLDKGRNGQRVKKHRGKRTKGKKGKGKKEKKIKLIKGNKEKGGKISKEERTKGKGEKEEKWKKKKRKRG